MGRKIENSLRITPIVDAVRDAEALAAIQTELRTTALIAEKVLRVRRNKLLANTLLTLSRNDAFLGKGMEIHYRAVSTIIVAHALHAERLLEMVRQQPGMPEVQESTEVQTPAPKPVKDELLAS